MFFFFCFKALTYIYIDFKYVVFSESDSLTGHMGWGPLCPLKKLVCMFQVFLPLLIYLHLMWQIFPSSSFFLSNTEMIPKSNAEQMPTMVWLSKNWTATIKQWNHLKVSNCSKGTGFHIQTEHIWNRSELETPAEWNNFQPPTGFEPGPLDTLTINI